MRILHVSVSDKDGAGKAARRLVEAQQAAGLDATLITRSGWLLPDGTEVAELVPAVPPLFSAKGITFRVRRRRFWRRRVQLVQNKDAGKEHFSLPEASEPGMGAYLASLGYDLVHLHWVAEWISASDLAHLSHHVPLVWSCHDMVPYTGGCHYTAGCSAFQTHCAHCPQLSQGQAGSVASLFATKQQAYAQVPVGRIAFVGLSRWMQQQAQASTLLRPFRVVHIPNTLDTDTWQRTQTKEEARAALKLPQDLPLVLFVASNPANSRKGWDLTLHLLNALQEVQQVGVLALGHLAKEAQHALRAPLFALGQVRDEAVLRQAYTAADAFVLASRQDNLPNTVAEAAAMQVPILATQVGGVADMLPDASCGWPVALEGGVPAMKIALQEMLQLPEEAARRAAEARRHIVQHIAPQHVVPQYQALYKEMLKA